MGEKKEESTKGKEKEKDPTTTAADKAGNASEGDKNAENGSKKDKEEPKEGMIGSYA